LPSREAAAGRDGSGDTFLDLTRLTPSAAIAEAEAADGVRAAFGLSGELERLPGEADHNFLLTTGAGRRYVVKFAHLRVDPRVVSVQTQVLRHIEASVPGLPVPRVVPTVSGKPWATVTDGPLRGRVVHVTTYLDGQLLRSVTTFPDLRHQLGETLASLGRALREFHDPLVRRPLLWDIAQLPRLRPLVAELPRAAGTSLLAEQLGRFTTEVAPRLAAQRTQLVHNDFSPDNVLISADLSRVCGIIDFGDVTVTALVNDVAIAAAYQLSDQTDLLGPAVDVIRGYHATTPLSASEVDLLPELILARVVARIVITQWRAVRFPENRAYIMRNTPRAWEHLNRLLAIPADQMAARIRGVCRAEATDA
jgi:hydroxylysine kinase